MKMNKKAAGFIIAVTAFAIGATSIVGAAGNLLGKGAETEMTGMANPNLYDLTEQEMLEKTGIDLPAPDGAEDVSWAVIGYESERPMAEMTFTKDGKEFFLRAQATDRISIFPESVDLTEMGEPGDGKLDELMNVMDVADDSEINISGIFGKWESGGTAVVADHEAMWFGCKDKSSFICWIDEVPGILYNLGTTDKVDCMTLMEVAEISFVPVQGES